MGNCWRCNVESPTPFCQTCATELSGELNRWMLSLVESEGFDPEDYDLPEDYNFVEFTSDVDDN